MEEKMNFILLVPILFPVIAGVFLLWKREFQKRRSLLIFVGAVLLLTGAFAAVGILGGERRFTAFYLTEELPVFFKLDELGRLFASLVTVVWILAGFFSFAYMKKEKREKRYFGFYLITFGVLLGLDFAGNLITMYLFYEFMTLASLPLVLHSQTGEARMAGLKYLFYSFCGAYLALFGVYFLVRMGNTIEFTPGGVFESSFLLEHQTLFLVITMLLVLGFGVKAGMFPLHAWLTAAHPVAPGPASGVLSGIIVKGGVLALIRVLYYLIGPDFLIGTKVQKAWIVLTLITIFMGSMLAFREPVLKKRLAYSTVSQVSYILFGLAVCERTAFEGALLHVIAHAFIKVCLFLCAGAMIYQTGCKRVEELRGIGKRMPVTLWCYTIASLGLIGIPPTSGFVSKWYLGTGALDGKMPVFSWLGPLVLIVSALLTAGYLLPVTMRGFFPGEGFACRREKEARLMTAPLIIFAALTLFIGIFPETALTVIRAISGVCI